MGVSLLGGCAAQEDHSGPAGTEKSTHAPSEEPSAGVPEPVAPVEPTLTPEEEREALLATFDIENDPTHEQWCEAAARTSGYLDAIGADPAPDEFDFDVFVAGTGEGYLGTVNCFLYLPDTVMTLQVGAYSEAYYAAEAYGMWSERDTPVTATLDVDAPAWEGLLYTEYEPGSASGTALLIAENAGMEWPIDGALEDRGAAALDVSVGVGVRRESTAPPLSTAQIQEACRALVEWVAAHQPPWALLAQAQR